MSTTDGDDGDDCHLCSCAGQWTPATTTRVVCDLGVRVVWRGEHIHPLCDQCAEQIDDDDTSDAECDCGVSRPDRATDRDGSHHPACPRKPR